MLKSLTDENQKPARTDDTAELTTFSQSRLSVAYPKNYKVKSEFQGDMNTFELKNPADRSSLSIIYSPLRGETYEQHVNTYLDRRFPNPVFSMGHPNFPGSTEVRSIGPVTPLAGSTGYWHIIVPVSDQKIVVHISVMAFSASDDETRLALAEWTAVINSIKIEPDNAVFTERDVINRFEWDGTGPAVFNYTFCPDFAFIGFYDSTAEFVWEFSDEDFEQAIAKAERSATFFIDQSLYAPASFHFNEPGPDPDDPTWANVVEGLIGVESGQLSFGAGTNWDEVNITLPNGVYRFRAYSAVPDYEAIDEDDNLEVRFYFNPTDEKETNKIIVLKGGRN